MKVYGLNARRVLSAASAAFLGLLVVTGPGFAIAASMSGPTPVSSAAALAVLSATDAQHYSEAFAAMHRGDFPAGAAALRGVSDATLIGRVEAARLLHSAYRADYPELQSWLERWADLPEASRVYDLALRRKPAGAAPPRAPVGSVTAKAVDSVSSAGGSHGAHQPWLRAASPAQEAARRAFYRGDVEQALVLATRSGERWIAGLSALRLQRYPEALASLDTLATDAGQSPWVRSAAAYWASRAAASLGDVQHARALLKTASQAPDTFYGLIAARQLDQQSARVTADLDPGADMIADLLAAASIDGQALAAFTRADPRAHRAAALAQLGFPIEAGEEIRNGLEAGPIDTRAVLTSLAVALKAPLGGRPDAAKSGWARFDAGHFPTPQLSPQGGFTIDKALVYALVRQESRFDPNSVSGSGAYGLMQLTAETAARTAGDERLRRNPSILRDPGLNLRLGQAYVTKLLAAVKGDVVRAVAAYNCGPGVIQKLTAKMGEDMDSLLMVESMPSGQTRDYVQRVMAGYWIYRQIFGHDSQTLDAAAAGGKLLATADL